MRKIIFAIFIISLISGKASAMEQAAPLDFIFKGGDYTETSALILEKPYSGKIQGPDNTVITFVCSDKCKFILKSADDATKTNIYTADKNGAIVMAKKQVSPAPEYTLGLVYKKETSELSWLVNENDGALQHGKWTRAFTMGEYPLISVQSTITARAGAHAVMVQYSGTTGNNSDIVFDITDTGANDMFAKKIIQSKDLPGYFEISNGGVIRIDKILLKGATPVLSYEWVKEPRIQAEDNI